MTMMLALAAVGCNQTLVGQWNLESTVPSDAKARYAVQTIRFNPDAKTYSAQMVIENKTRVDSGDYTFNGFQLKFKRKDGPPRTYDAMYNSFTRRLEMTHTRDGKKTTAIYGKVESAKQ